MAKLSLKETLTIRNMNQINISDKTKQLIKDYPDEAYEINREGYNQGVIHRTPSKGTEIFMEDTIKLFKQMEDKVEKIKDEIFARVGNMELNMERLVREIFDKIDDKYARKEKVNNLVIKVDAIEKERESRSYEWLKYLITAIVGGVVGVVLTHSYN